MISDYEEVVIRFKAYRISYPLTQKELSDKSGVSLRSITRFESGEDITFIYTAAVEYFGEGITFSESDKLPGYIYDGYTNCVYDIDGTPYQFVYKSNEEVYIRNYKDY